VTTAPSTVPKRSRICARWLQSLRHTAPNGTGKGKIRSFACPINSNPRNLILLIACSTDSQHCRKRHNATCLPGLRNKRLIRAWDLHGFDFSRRRRTTVFYAEAFAGKKDKHVRFQGHARNAIDLRARKVTLQHDEHSQGQGHRLPETSGRIASKTAHPSPNALKRRNISRRALAHGFSLFFKLHLDPANFP